MGNWIFRETDGSGQYTIDFIRRKIQEKRPEIRVMPGIPSGYEFFSSAFDSAEVERRAKEALEISREDVIDVDLTI